jgi:hypothetical protein
VRKRERSGSVSKRAPVRRSGASGAPDWREAQHGQWDWNSHGLSGKIAEPTLEVSKNDTDMTEIAQLIATIKLQLKAAGMTYRDVAQALDLSEPSVKRLLPAGG